jgi:micrococcal nuclease
MIVRALLISVAAVVALAETPRVETVDGDRIQIVDGDTVRLPCRLQDCVGPERIRILNIDAPEIGHPSCEAEEELGWRAKEALARLLRGRPVTIARCETATRCTDRYGRTLARLSTSDGDVGEALVASGHAQRWAPGATVARGVAAGAAFVTHGDLRYVIKNGRVVTSLDKKWNFDRGQP